MEWKEEHRIGIRDIDEQHQVIAQCIASLKQAVTRQDGWSDVHSGLVSLATLIQTHFQVEESLMRIHDYPHIDEHADDHLRFSAELKTLLQRVLTTNVLHDKIHFLHEWWDEHIQKHDKPYAVHFLKRQALGRA